MEDLTFDDIPQYTGPSPKKKASGSGSSKWTDRNQQILAAVCVAVARKGYRTNNSFKSDGWKYIVQQFNKKTKNNYTLKSIQNQYNVLKKQWVIYKNNVMQQTGLGWTTDGRRIVMEDNWWNETIKVKPEMKAFRGKDLTVFIEHGFELFDGHVATGANRKRPSQFSRQDQGQSTEGGTGEDMEDSDPNIDGMNERSDSSDDGVPMMFDTPPNSTHIGFSVGSSGSAGSKRQRDGSQIKGKGKMSSGMAFKTGIEEWIHFKKTDPTPKSSAPSIEECVEALDRARDILAFNDYVWCTVHQAFVDKEGIRNVFMKLKNDEARAKWAMAFYETNSNRRG